MKKYLIGLIILCQSVLTTGVLIQPVMAQTAQTAYQGLDVLFLVDQSGSMGGAQFNSSGTGPARDPLGLRFQAVQYAFQTLSAYRSVVASGTAFQMGVINFGDTSEVALPWTAIEPDTADWQQKQQQILNQLSDTRFGFRNLGNTNFMAAYQEAQSMFNALPQGSTSNKHLRAIIILTDGAPCVPTEFSNPACSSSQDRLQHMDNVLQFTASAFPAPDNRLYVIALTDRFSFWPQLEPTWKQIVGMLGSAQRIERSEQVGPGFLNILRSLVQAVQPANNTQGLIGKQVTISGVDSSIDVPPYYKSMRLTLFKTQPDSQITLIDPNGHALSEMTPQVRISGLASPIEAWTISDPAPGQWKLTISKEGDLLDAYVDLIAVSWTLDAPSQTVLRQTAVPLTLRVLNSQNQPLPDYSQARFALKVAAGLHMPDGAVQQITFKQSAPGTYTANVVPEQAGTYEIDLLATTQHLNGAILTVANQKAVAQFAVSGLTLNIRPLSSREILQTQPLVLSAQINDEQGKIIADAEVEAIITGASGTQHFPLTRQDDDTFAGSIPMNTQGQWKVDLQAVVPQSNGDPLVITKNAGTTVTVKPVTMARLEFVGPDANATHYTTYGFPTFAANPVLVRIAATNSDNQPLDLTTAAAGQIPLQLQLFDAENREVAQEIHFVATEKGFYEAKLTALAAGQYRLVLQPDESLTADTGVLFEADSKARTMMITMATNPALFVTFGVVAAFAMGSMSGAGFMAYRRRQRRQHPATGRIAILREDLSLNIPDRDTIWSLSLDSKYSNHIVIKRLPGNLRSLIIECPDNNLSKRGQVIVTLDGKKRTLFKRITMGRGSERVIDEISDGETVYYLAKDHDND